MGRSEPSEVGSTVLHFRDDGAVRDPSELSEQNQKRLGSTDLHGCPGPRRNSVSNLQLGGAAQRGRVTLTSSELTSSPAMWIREGVWCRPKIVEPIRTTRKPHCRDDRSKAVRCNSDMLEHSQSLSRPARDWYTLRWYNLTLGAIQAGRARDASLFNRPDREIHSTTSSALDLTS